MQVSAVQVDSLRLQGPTPPVRSAQAVGRTFGQDRSQVSAAGREALAREREATQQDPRSRTAGEADPAESSTGEDDQDSGAAADPSHPRDRAGRMLSEPEVRQVRELQRRDAEVRTHEQAHVAAGGGHVRGGPSYTYQQGPDGRRYAVGGSVPIDTAPEAEPEDTIRKMQQVRRAALAPAQPSSADRAIAATATAHMAQARLELAIERAEATAPGGSSAAEDGSDSDEQAEAAPPRGVDLVA